MVPYTSLALLTLAGATLEEVDVEYVEVDDVTAFVQRPRMDFDLVALSTYTARAFDAYLVADAYRALGVPVVFGGLHASVLPEEAARHAEAPMPRFDLLTQAAPDANGARLDTSVSGEINRLGSYNRITVQTTRGCPWDCHFCAASKLYGPRYRIKPVEKILAEVDAIRTLWRRPFIEFADDNTFVHKAWSKQLLRELADRHIRYFTETDVSIAEDEELLDLLYPSGCRQVLIGFETPRASGLEGIDRANWKARQSARYLGAIEKIQSRGVSVCGCFIVGLDSDTVDTFDELREFIDRSRLLEVQVTILTPFPGTRLYQQLLEEDRLLHPGQWDRCTLFDLNFRPRGMTVDQLEDNVMQLWRDCWNGDALAARKSHYQRLLRARRGTSESPGPDSAASQYDAANKYFPVPADGVATEDRAGIPYNPIGSSA